MITIEHAQVEDIPFLHIVDETKHHGKLPLVIFVHGFTSRKEFNLHYAYLLAEKGYRVILPDALHHGDRGTGLAGHQLNTHFWEIIIKTIDELEIVKNYFEKEELIDQGRIGLAGTSMGGIVTLGALTRYRWIKVAVSLMGMPYYEKFALKQIDTLKLHGVNIPLTEEELNELMDKIKELDLSLQPEKLENRPLLFWHGKQDTVVPFAPAYQFYESIQSLYGNVPDRLKFISEEKAGHKVSTNGVLETVKWFENHL